MKVKIKKIKVILLFVLILLSIVFVFIYSNNIKKTKIFNYFDTNVVTLSDVKIYKKISNDYKLFGIAHSGCNLKTLENYDENNNYIMIQSINNDNNNNYFIEVNNIKKVDVSYNVDKRYKNYIVFNQNIIIDKNSTLYNEYDKEVFTLEEEIELPIIIKDEEKYYIEYNNMLLYVLKENVKDIINVENTDIGNTSGIAVLNYHFVYNPNEENCDQEICHTEKQFKEHMSYIKDNNYFTPTMKELEMYIDGKIRLPKSVVITLDDGRNINVATKILEEYKLNATAFIVTSRYNIEEDFIKSDYVELQSHSDALHDAGSCPAGHGQGGGLTCFDDDKILKDLSTSREKLNGATAFCYPFYEYNEHSIELLKKSGFTMAFGGEYEGGQINAKVGINKFKIPRWVMVTWTTMEKFKSYLDGGE